MKRAPFLPLALCAAALAGCGAGPDDRLLELRLGSLEPRPGYEAALFEGDTLYLAPDPVISDGDIDEATPFLRDDAVLVEIRLSPDGARRLQETTGRHIGQLMAVLFDGRVVSTPVIQSRIGAGDPSLLGSIPARSSGQAREIAARVRARWPPAPSDDPREP